MASTWSKDRSIGSFGSKMRVRADVVRQDRANNNTRLRVRIYAYNGGGSRTFNVGSGAALSLVGDVSFSGRQTFNIAARSWETLLDQEFTVPHSSDGRKSFSITGSLSDTGTTSLGNGGALTLTGSFDPLYLAPSAPTWGATEYQSATTVKISWVNRATARGAYDRIDIQRWDRASGDWLSRGSLSASATSYTNVGVPGNTEIQYRVRAVGPGGRSGWVTGGTLGTVPATPTGVAARKSGTDIRVSWTDRAAGTNRTRTFLIDDNPDGTGWVRVGTIGGSAEAWTHVDPDPARTHQYRVTAQITSQITLSSTVSAASGVVQLQAPPKAPTLLSPEDGVPREKTAPVTFQWQHNPVDTTAQTAAELRYNVDYGDWVVLDISSFEDITVPFAVAAERSILQWQVRTAGDHPDFGPWSELSGFWLSTTPEVVIQSPTEAVPVETSRVSVSWTYQPNGTDPLLQQAYYEARLSDFETGTPLDFAYGNIETTVDFTARLQNHTQYVITVSARNGDGLWSAPYAVTFTTDFPLPQPVLCFPSWDRETASVSVEFAVQSLPDHIRVDALDVERREPGGDWVLIASGIDTSSTITDRIPRIGQLEYRAISRTVLPTETVGPEHVLQWPFPRVGVWVSGGPGFDRICTARGSSASDSPEIEQSTQRFAGIQKPVAFFGTGRSHGLSFTGTIPLAPNPTTVSTREDWLALLHEYGVVVYRDPVGRKVFGLLTVSFSQTGPVESLSLSVEEVGWSEDVRHVTDQELEARL